MACSNRINTTGKYAVYREQPSGGHFFGIHITQENRVIFVEDSTQRAVVTTLEKSIWYLDNLRCLERFDVKCATSGPVNKMEHPYALAG